MLLDDADRLVIHYLPQDSHLLSLETFPLLEVLLELLIKRTSLCFCLVVTTISLRRWSLQKRCLRVPQELASKLEGCGSCCAKACLDRSGDDGGSVIRLEVLERCARETLD